MNPKPHTCMGCALYDKGKGYAEPDGPSTADLCFWGEALGKDEARLGKNFAGAAGTVLDYRLLKSQGLEREQVRVSNVLRCQPPGDWLVGSPWEYDAIERCGKYRSRVLDHESHKVHVTLGATPTRVLLDLPKMGMKIKNWHGCPTQRSDGQWVVPTFHPAFLTRQPSMTGVVHHDITKAREVAAGTWKPQNAVLHVDPDPAWFAAWVDEYLQFAKTQQPWLAVDIETPDKGEDEGEQKGISWDIDRINFAYHPDEGVTVPWAPPYIELIKLLLAGPGVKWFWKQDFDVPRIRHAGAHIEHPIMDGMDAWHVLQSDMSFNGLGFVAPFYSNYGAWKHLSGIDPGRYAAIDAVQTLRVVFGIAADLKQLGMWDSYYRHIYLMDELVLRPAERIGLEVNEPKLAEFGEECQVRRDGLDATVQKLAPASICPEHMLVRKPKDPVVLAEHLRVTRKVITKKCMTCKETDITKTHVCKDPDGSRSKTLIPDIQLGEHSIERWVKKLPFNPASPYHIRAYIESKGHKPGRISKKSKSQLSTTDKKTLIRLARSTKDPMYQSLTDLRAVDKVLGTYVHGAQQRLRKGRLHPTFTHKPSTGRLSCRNPNIQNVVSRGDDVTLASGFRKCIQASPGKVLVEIDFSGIEAMMTGWFAQDPDYIRLATLGVHAFLCSHEVGKPADLKWSDADLIACFNDIKASFPVDYARAKRVVHGTSYGLTPIGLVNNYPDQFDRKSATALQQLFFSIAPKIPKWQRQVRNRAQKQKYLGGADHPFGYRHWFWDVANYDKRAGTFRPGGDSNRTVAFYPQSTAAGVLYEANLRMFDNSNPLYIGEMDGGGTPLRALIHDSDLFEIGKEHADVLISAAVKEMTKPIPQLPMPAEWGMGAFMQVGVEAKMGTNWAEMEIVVPGQGVAPETKVIDYEDEEEVA